MSPNTKSAPSVSNELDKPAQDLKTYFRRVEMRFFFGLLGAFFIPLCCLSAYFHYQFHVTLKETSKLNLVAIAESQRNTVDLFLQERLVNLFSLFHNASFDLTPSQLQMDKLLSQLRQSSDAFIDVGLLTHNGRQIGYAGPFPYLQNKDYSAQGWFINLMSRDSDHFISDIYLGFRNKLHFTIAVRQSYGEILYAIRATLDPDKFYLFLKTINHAKGVESYLVNNAGRIQLADPWNHALLDLSSYVPPMELHSGANTIHNNGDRVLMAHAWLTAASWALVVNEPLSVAYAQLYQARKIMLISTAVLLVVVITVIWIGTHIIVGRAGENAHKREELTSQLLHASKLASLGEVATGVAHEINNPLAIIVATTGVIKDMLNPEFNLNATPEQLVEELNVVEEAVFRARDITRQLLDYGRKNLPHMVSANINAILEDVLGGFKERALLLDKITVTRQLDPNVGDAFVDPDQIRQVFINLINNAGDAIQGPGKITIATEQSEDTVRITVTDTGKGMDSEQMKKIFDPFFTTKEVGKGTGLGLSVSIGIVESMGGTIEVQSLPGAGSAFTVILPNKQNKGAINGQSNAN